MGNIGMKRAVSRARAKTSRGIGKRLSTQPRRKSPTKRTRDSLPF